MKKLLMTASVWQHIRSFHLPYLREFRRLGWETHVGCRGIPADAPYIDRPIELPFEKRMSSRKNFGAARILRDKIASEGYDLIITHTSLAAFFTRLAVRGFDSIRTINVCHGYLFDDNTAAPRRGVLLGAERFAAPQTDLLLTMNAWDCRAARKYRLAKKIELIPGMGVDFSKLDKAAAPDGAALRRRYGIAGGAFVLLCAAEFSERKSQRVLIEAMPLLPERAVLALCGDGALLAECRALADKLGVGARVLFPGRAADMAPWYRMADAAVSASRSEGLPFNVMEAMHAGVPVAASAVKGHTDLIEDGKTGLLYPYGDAAACAAQLRILMGDETLRGNLRGNARSSVERYRLDTVLPEVMGRYLNVHKEELRESVMSR